MCVCVCVCVCTRVCVRVQELPELWALHQLLPSVAQQLSHSACSELIPLMEIPGVRQVNTPSLPPSLPPSTFASLSPSSQGRAKQLLQAGYPTPQSLASLSPSVLCERVDHLYPKQARRIIQAAKVTCRSYILATLKIVMWYVYVCMCVCCRLCCGKRLRFSLRKPQT